MKKSFKWLPVFFVLFFSTGSAFADPQDVKGGKDPSFFSRMPGYYISNYEEQQFGTHEFQVDANQRAKVEGAYYYYDYYAKEGIKPASPIQVTRNYESAAKAIGGKVIYSFEDGGLEYTTLKIEKEGTEIWAEVSSQGNMYKVWIIQKQEMKQDVVATAEKMANTIGDSGKVAVYGIYFDTAKADIKPESTPALQEIAKLLNANAGLKLYVVGHTDSAGGLDYNMKLSRDRAAAVMKELVGKYGIAAARLQAHGVGQLAPVASNQTEKGRALNRRVELVAQ